MAENTIAAGEHIRKHLEQINLHLQLVNAGILVSAGALKHQNCERDEEIASVLVHCVSERLALQMERLAEIAAQLEEFDPRTSSCGGSEPSHASRH